MFSPRNLVLFDFNGVIADDEPVHQMLLQKVCAGHGVTITDQEYHDIYLGYDDRRAFAEAFATAGKPVGPVAVEELIAQKSALYDAYIKEHLVLFPGAVESVLGFDGKVALGIVSGALMHEIKQILTTANIFERFSLIVAAEDTQACKPHPEGYLKALALRNLALAPEGVWVRPEDCVVIEDSVAGVASAKAAGMRCVAVTHSYQAAELPHADRIIDRMADFTPALVRDLLGR